MGGRNGKNFRKSKRLSQDEKRARSLHNSTCPHQNRNFKAGKRPLGENARLRARKNIVIVLKMLSFLFILAVERGDKMYAKESREQDRGRLRAGTKESVTTFHARGCAYTIYWVSRNR